MIKLVKIEITTISYTVYDYTNKPVGYSAHPYTASFKLTFEPNNIAPNGTEPTLVKSSGVNDENGHIVATIKSGTNAGTIKLIATITFGSGADQVTIVSTPVKVMVHSGFPDKAHFTIAASRFVFPGIGIAGNYIPFTVFVGDTFSNPVQKGTVILFGSKAGIMETNDAVTNDDGQASRSLITCNPNPIIAPYCD